MCGSWEEAADVVTPAANAPVNQAELLMANLLHSSTANWNAAAPVPAGTELDAGLQPSDVDGMHFVNVDAILFCLRD